ncbi:isoprenyl transferase [Thiocystis violacea]|uniref:isoprenyl transferase n=1 Tax=Thiocystis violacea TaxID=13725 RepID=UPI0019075B2D|nr:isoprenyl transferase [Thiocystis violacea]MBK1720925.1 di-trans,poly-cis-decaprenylcistransferase [Thiocystis violacea]
MASAAERRMPSHVAIIMDGNGRWAKQRGLPRTAGHREGVKSVRAVVEESVRRGVETLTLFAFSSENWQRPRTEVNILMELFVSALRNEVKRLHENQVRLRIIGERSAFPEKLQHRIAEAEALTADNNRLNLQVAANYGGRWDIVQAARRMLADVQAGRLQPEAIDEQVFAEHLSFPDLPEPDLFIRTGGEQRLSNFVLWQSAYAELYFTDTLWPAFNESAYGLALDDYARRQRRFGRTGEQVETLAAVSAYARG